MSIVLADQIGFQLEEKLGEGLNSTVYRAIRSGFGLQTVALKIPKDQTAIPLLRREFETLQQIHSMHCVRLIGWESFGGSPALVLEWIDGVTLTELSKHPLSSDEREEIIRQIHVGLEDLHFKDLVHGDLHPNNVMIDRSGHVKLIDFACGDVRDGRRQAVPAFASPEIWKGADPSPSSDLFALQILRDHMATGFASLPERSSARVPLQIAARNERAKQSIARRLSGSVVIETQVIETDAASNETGFQAAGETHFEQFTIRSAPRSALHRAINSPHARISRELGRRLGLRVRVASAACVIFAMASMTVSAEAPSQTPPKNASLKVTSQNWMRVSLNGREVGYTPLEIKHLSTGRHHLVWESAASRGELTFELRPNETLRLNAKLGRLAPNAN